MYCRNTQGAPQNRELTRDIDGQWFLNYLDAILLAEDDVGPFYDELEEHRDVIPSRLYRVVGARQNSRSTRGRRDTPTGSAICTNLTPTGSMSTLS